MMKTTDSDDCRERRMRLLEFFGRRSQNIELFNNLHRFAFIPARQGEKIVYQLGSCLRFGSVNLKQPEIYICLVMTVIEGNTFI